MQDNTFLLRKYLLLLFHKFNGISGFLKYSLQLAKLKFFRYFKEFKWQALIVGIFTLTLIILLWQGFGTRENPESPPLAMKGGDPYIRALMRTITASEAQDSNPYTLLYGGKHFSDFKHHPNQCVTIFSGSHKGECSTAAGRYQILTVTWQEKVKKYHHKFSKLLNVNPDSFEPQIQDEVVYAWLNDYSAWGVNIADLLQQGKLNQVLQLLSGTWTSLGYGKENNSITPLLSQVYQKVLAEEFEKVNVIKRRHKILFFNF